MAKSIFDDTPDALLQQLVSKKQPNKDKQSLAKKPAAKAQSKVPSKTAKKKTAKPQPGLLEQLMSGARSDINTGMDFIGSLPANASNFMNDYFANLTRTASQQPQWEQRYGNAARQANIAADTASSFTDINTYNFGRIPESPQHMANAKLGSDLFKTQLAGTGLVAASQIPAPIWAALGVGDLVNKGLNYEETGQNLVKHPLGEGANILLDLVGTGAMAKGAGKALTTPYNKAFASAKAAQAERVGKNAAIGPLVWGVGGGASGVSRGTKAASKAANAVNKAAKSPIEDTLGLADIKISKGLPKEPLRDRLSATIQKARTDYFNRYAPIDDLAKGRNLKPSENPSVLLKRFSGGMGIANQKIDDELTPILRQTGNHDDLRKFLVAERSNELADRGIGKRADRALEELRAKVGDQEYGNFQKIANDLYGYQRQFIDQLKESGFLSEAQHSAIVSQNQKYIPFNRVMDDLESNGVVAGARSVNSSKNPINKIQGSERDIIDPIESVIRNTYDITKAVEKNRIISSLTALGEDVGVTPLRTAENVNRRFDIWSELKEWKPGRQRLLRMMKSDGKQIRALESAVNALNKKGLNLSLKTKAAESPATLATKVKVTVDKSKLLNLISSNENRAKNLQREMAKLERKGYKTALTSEAKQGPEQLTSGIVTKSKPTTVRFGESDEVVGGSLSYTKIVGDKYATTKNKGQQSTRAFIESLITKPNVDIQRIKAQVATRENKLGELLDEIAKLRNEYETSNAGYISAKQIGTATTTNRGAQSTKNFIEALITDPSTDIQQIKKMVATKENKLGTLLDDLQVLRDAFSQVQARRGELFDEAKLLRDASARGKATVNVYRDGVREIWEVPKEVEAAIKGIDEEQLNLAVKAMALPARMLRAGATGLNVGFAVPNVLRDQLTAAVNSKYGGIPVYDFVSGLASVVKKDDAFKSWIASGADQASFFAQDRTMLQRTVKDVTGGKWSRAGRVVKNPLELLRAVGEYSEKGSRVGVYKRALKGAEGKLLLQKAGLRKNPGLSGEDAILDAMVQSREATVDFARRGSKMKAINAIIPFLNARTQGTLKLLQSAKQRPLQTMLIGGSIAAVPAAILHAHNSQYPEYNEIPQYLKDTNFIIMTGDEKTPFVKIPKGEIGQIFGNPTESFMDHLNNKDSQSYKDVAVTLLGQMSPINNIGDIVPTAFKPPIEIMANYDTFRGRNIVSPYQKDLPPELQFNNKTTEGAKALGNKIGVSPALLEHALTGYTAGVGTQGLNIIDQLMKGEANPIQSQPVLDRFLGEPRDLTATTQKLYEEKEKAKQSTARENYRIKQQLMKGDMSALQGLSKQKANALINSVKQQTVGDSLPQDRKFLYDLSKSERAKILAQNPDLANKVIDSIASPEKIKESAKAIIDVARKENWSDPLVLEAFEALHPMYGLDEKSLRNYMESKTPEERQRFIDAVKYYEETFSPNTN